MSNTTIFEIENSIMNLINDIIVDDTNINIHLGTPQGFLMQINNDLPCILISYSGTEPHRDMYPGNLIFSIYFISNREDRQTIYELMQKVFDRLQHSIVLDLNAGFKLQFDKFEYEDTEFLIFTQQWGCTKIN